MDQLSLPSFATASSPAGILNLRDLCRMDQNSLEPDFARGILRGALHPETCGAECGFGIVLKTGAKGAFVSRVTLSQVMQPHEDLGLPARGRNNLTPLACVVPFHFSSPLDGSLMFSRTRLVVLNRYDAVVRQERTPKDCVGVLNVKKPFTPGRKQVGLQGIALETKENY